MTPTIVFNDGQPVLTVGSPGGQTIITSVLQTILNTYEYDLSLQEALNEPRIFTNGPDSYSYEEGIPEDVISELNDMGHGFTEDPAPIGNVNSIMYNEADGTYTGATDENRNGAAFGFEMEPVEQ